LLLIVTVTYTPCFGFKVPSALALSIKSLSPEGIFVEISYSSQTIKQCKIVKEAASKTPKNNPATTHAIKQTMKVGI
jgi:hypothetical protein